MIAKCAKFQHKMLNRFRVIKVKKNLNQYCQGKKKIQSGLKSDSMALAQFVNRKISLLYIHIQICMCMDLRWTSMHLCTWLIVLISSTIIYMYVFACIQNISAVCS